jgi:predicted HTH domain antitoxin
MTAKRFIIMDNLPKGTHSNIWDKQKQHNQGIGDELWLGEVVAMLNEGVILAEENEQLKSENKRLTDKLNKIALELVEDVISQGKAVEISEMSYSEFLDYRAKNGKPMELQL